MSLYAIGDIQGCWPALQTLLERIDFGRGRHRLWLTGDLVNRGGHSLEVLRWAWQQRKRITVVLGNHDLALLAYAAGVGPRNKANAEFDRILAAEDGERLLEWLRHRPLLHLSADGCLVHAGLPPWWNAQEARKRAAQVEKLLQGPEHRRFLAQMFGDEPSLPEPGLGEIDSARLTVNALTRMRFCDAQGRINLREKGAPAAEPDGLYPWFAVPGRKPPGRRVFFGHWSALGLYRHEPWYGLDTGAVWGGRLTAINVRDLAEVVQVDNPVQQES